MLQIKQSSAFFAVRVKQRQQKHRAIRRGCAQTKTTQSSIRRSASNEHVRPWSLSLISVTTRPIASMYGAAVCSAAISAASKRGAQVILPRRFAALIRIAKSGRKIRIYRLRGILGEIYGIIFMLLFSLSLLFYLLNFSASFTNLFLYYSANNSKRGTRDGVSVRYLRNSEMPGSRT